jgi:16S rRNA processing protein RimM
MNKPEGYLHFGTSRKPHGIKGGFELFLLNTEESQLEKGSKVLLIPESSASSLASDGQEFEIEKIVFGHKVMLNLVGVNDRNEAERMLPFQLWYPRSELEPLEEGEYYLTDLHGLNVQDENSLVYGSVESFYFNGAHDVAVIKLLSGGLMDIPFIEPFLLEIDQDQSLITLKKCEMVE